MCRPTTSNTPGTPTTTGTHTTAADDATPADPTPRPRQSIATLPLVALILLYRATLARLLGGHCRFHPSCSQYALDALAKHGPWRGTLKTLHRLSRCHPFAKGGYDPA